MRSVLECSGSDSLEVVVVDDGSTDDTRWKVEGLVGSGTRVRLVPQPQGGKARALNSGMRYARGVTCLITDADCRVPASWVACRLVNSVAANE